MCEEFQTRPIEYPDHLSLASDDALLRYGQIRTECAEPPVPGSPDTGHCFEFRFRAEKRLVFSRRFYAENGNSKHTLNLLAFAAYIERHSR